VADYYRAGSGLRPPAAALQSWTDGLAGNDAARLSALLTAFLASDWAALSTPLEVERPVNLLLPAGGLTVRITGALDLLLAKDLQIVDFKTEREITPAARANHALQMYLYREALARETGREPPAPVLVHVRPEGLQALPLTPDELAAQAPRLEALLGRLAAHASGAPCPPVPGPHCAWCTFAGVCAEGGQAAKGPGA